MEELAGVPDACTAVERALVVTETVKTGVKGTAGKELSYLFSKRRDDRRESKKLKDTLNDNTRVPLS